MNFPTGMGLATGVHYNDVAAKMNHYVNHGTQHSVVPDHGYFHPTHSAVHGNHRHSHNHGPHFMGMNPGHAHNSDDVARGFMRGLFS